MNASKKLMFDGLGPSSSWRTQETIWTMRTRRSIHCRHRTCDLNDGASLSRNWSRASGTAR